MDFKYPLNINNIAYIVPQFYKYAFRMQILLQDLMKRHI